MGFDFNNIKAGDGVKPSPTLKSKVDNNDHKLSKEEIEYLILLIKDSKFLGEHLEIVYNIVIKLQNQHINT